MSLPIKAWMPWVAKSSVQITGMALLTNGASFCGCKITKLMSYWSLVSATFPVVGVFTRH